MRFGNLAKWILRVSRIDMDLPSPPFLDIDGVRNFRDIGGYPTSSDRLVRRGLVYRSGDFKRLTARGREKLEELGVTDIFDLRSHKEITSAMVNNGEAVIRAWEVLSNGPDRHIVPIFTNEDFSPEAFVQRFSDYTEEGTQGFQKVYHLMVKRAGPVMAQIVRHIASLTTRAPIVIHCMAGKDRTGVVVMLLLLLAGCSRETIVKEYALSNIGLGLSHLSEDPKSEGKEASVSERPMRAREEVMMAVLLDFDREWGSAEQYLLSLGVELEDIEACRDVLLA